MTLKLYIADEANKVRSEITEKLRQLKLQGKKFTTSVDEQTTAANFRILNVQIYSEAGLFNLGMARINVACPAAIMVQVNMCVYKIA